MRVLLALALVLLVGACGDDEPRPPPPPPAEVPPPPGVYELDPDKTFERMKSVPDQKVTIEDVRVVAIRFELKSDGTFEGRTTTPEERFEAKGTWKSHGSAAVLLTTEVNGVRQEPPDEKTLEHKDGLLYYDANESTWPIVLRKR